MRTIVALVALTAGLPAAEYHVATDGDDRAAGTRGAPFRTLARAVAAANRPGDTVLVRQGIHRPAGTLNLAQSGVAGRPVTLRAAANETAVVDGGGLPADANLIAVLGHHVRVQGLTIRNAPGTGISVWGPGARVHEVEVTGNTVHHCGRGGIFVACNSPEDPVRDVRVESNTVHQVVLRNRSAPRAQWDFALGTGQSRNVTLRGNTVHHGHGEGIGFYLATQGAAIGNVVYDNFSVNLYLDNATHTRVEGNLIYSTGDAGFHRFGHPAGGIQIANEEYPGRSNPSAHNVIINNLLIGNRCAIQCASYQRGGGLRHTLIAHNTAVGATGTVLDVDADPGHRDSRVCNNVFVQFGRRPLTDVAGPVGGIEFRNNLWSGGVPQGAARGPGDVLSDPLFVTGGKHAPASYLLRAESPARGAGVGLKDVLADFGGNPRQPPPDLGAWQTRP